MDPSMTLRSGGPSAADATGKTHGTARQPATVAATIKTRIRASRQGIAGLLRREQCGGKGGGEQRTYDTLCHTSDARFSRWRRRRLGPPGMFPAAALRYAHGMMARLCEPF